MNENSFKFKKGDLEIEISGEKDFVEEQVKIWKIFLETKIFRSSNNDIQITASEKNLKDTNTPIFVKKNITIDDFLILKNPDNNSDKTLVAGYFLEKYDKQESFTEIDIYRILNIEDVEKYLMINLEKGYISKTSERNNLPDYTLTYSGEMYVKDGLQN